MKTWLERHPYPKLTNDKIRLLDFGFGVGLSTKIVLSHLMDHSPYVEAIGVDISEKNLEIAQKELPQVHFKCLSTDDNLNHLGQFALILCNFFLVEMTSDKMLDVLKLLQTKLSSNGILMVTNPTANAYRRENHWYSFNNQFPENKPRYQSALHKKLKYTEDQPIKVQVFASKTRHDSFIFFDHFHSGTSYRTAYTNAGLKLVGTYKPVGHKADKIAWQSEETTSPYKIHVLTN